MTGFSARLAAGLLCTLALTTAGCSDTVAVDTPPPTAPPTPAVTRPFALPRTADSVHPLLAGDRIHQTFAPLVWEGLFALDRTFVPQKVLCANYLVSEDGLTWTFQLRTDVTFSDGSPLTAWEVAASLELARTAPGGRYVPRLSAVRKVSAAAEHTVTVTLARPNGALPALLDIPVVKGDRDEPLGTGPYVLEGWGDNCSLIRRTDWWQGKTLPLDEIPLATVRGADDLIYAFDAGDISLVTDDFTGSQALGYTGDYEAWDCPTTTLLYLGYHTDAGPAKHSSLRQAVTRALDRDSIAATLYARHALPAALPLSPLAAAYDEALAGELSYAPETVETILTDGGYVRRDGIWRLGSAPVSLDLVVNSENSFRCAVADFLAAALTDLGLPTAVRRLAWGNYQAALRKGDFDLFLAEVTLTADFDLTPLVGSSGALNYGAYKDAGADALLSAFCRAEGELRTAAARDLYRHLAATCPIAPLCMKNTSVLTRWGAVSGLAPTQQNPFHQMEGWTISR